MSTAMAMPGNTASTYLIHMFGTGLADERFVVERFRALANGEIRPVRARGGGVEGPAGGEARGGLAQAGRGDAP